MIFADEYEYLIHLLKSALHKTTPEEMPENLSFSKVLEYGKEHEVANIAYLAVSELAVKPDDAVMNEWTQVYWKAVQRDNVQSRAKKELLDVVHSRGIDTLEVQGTIVKKYYPEPHLRMMSDIDFIVGKEHLAEIETILEELGYQTHDPNGTEIDGQRGNAAVEFHTDFFDEGSTARFALNNAFSLAEINEDHTATVTDTVFYLYHLLHTVKHCINGGSGIRRIVDLYYLEDAMRDKADMEYIDSVLKEHDFYGIKSKLVKVKDLWFNGIVPDEDVSEIEADIIIAGNHGKEELINRHRFAWERSTGKKFVRLRYALRQVFPRKESIYAQYPFCEKHRYPIVLCWIHRFNCLIFSKERHERIKDFAETAKRRSGRG